MRKVLTLFCLLSILPIVQAAKTRQDLDDTITDINSTVEASRQQDRKVIDTINYLVSDPLTIVVGNVLGVEGGTIDLPIVFKAGTPGVAGLQFDVSASSVSFVSATAGAASTAAGKTVQGQQLNGKFRVIIFGLNQTVIGTGVLAILRVTVPTGPHIIAIDGIVGSSASGTPIEVFGKDGTISVE